MKAFRWLPLTLLLGVALTACGGGEKAFTVTSVREIVLQPSEAPSGTDYVNEQSGPVPLEQFFSTDEERAKLKELGLEGIYNSSFATPGLFPLPEDLSKLAPNAHFIGSNAVVFKDADGAHEATRFEEQTVFPEVTKGRQDVKVEGLGEDAVGFKFVAFRSFPVPGVFYGFRVGNALFAVVAVGVPGSVTAEEALALAQKVAARARQ